MIKEIYLVSEQCIYLLVIIKILQKQKNFNNTNSLWCLLLKQTQSSMISILCFKVWHLMSSLEGIFFTLRLPPGAHFCYLSHKEGFFGFYVKRDGIIYARYFKWKYIFLTKAKYCDVDSLDIRWLHLYKYIPDELTFKVVHNSNNNLS